VKFVCLRVCECFKGIESESEAVAKDIKRLRRHSLKNSDKLSNKSTKRCENFKEKNLSFGVVMDEERFNDRGGFIRISCVTFRFLDPHSIESTRKSSSVFAFAFKFQILPQTIATQKIRKE
jgi:hypothetical protein